MGYTTPLINNLKIRTIFKDKAGEEGVGVTDLKKLAISTQKVGLIEPVKL